MKRFITLGALIAALALVTASGFVVPTVRADGVIPLHNATAATGTDCPVGGAAYWHFVLAPNGGGYSFTSITLAFAGGGTQTFTGSAIIPNKAQTDNVFVAVPAGRALTDLVTTGSFAAYTGVGTPNQFNLSHVCPGTVPPTTEPPTTPPTTEPATTEPATTEPATTEPATTEPATTEPETTIPGSVFPPTTPPTTVAPTTPTTGVPSVTTTTVAGQTAGPTTTAAALPTTGGAGTTTAIGAALALAAGAVMTLTARRHT